MFNSMTSWLNAGPAFANRRLAFVMALTAIVTAVLIGAVSGDWDLGMTGGLVVGLVVGALCLAALVLAGRDRR